MLNRVRFRRKSKIPSILTGFSLDSSPKEGYFLDLRHGFVNYPEIGNNPSGFLTLAGSVESAGKVDKLSALSRQYADFSAKKYKIDSKHQ
nr:hypothetical protein [Klebsiella pneumoniae subsp. pneumoniae]